MWDAECCNDRLIIAVNTVLSERKRERGEVS